YSGRHAALGVVQRVLDAILQIVVNPFAVDGEHSFNSATGLIEDPPLQSVFSISSVYLPLLYHAVLGIYIVLATRNNVRRYGFFRNWMFFLQRISGIITLIFIAWHIWQTKIQIAFFNVELNYQLMEDILTQPFFFWFYAISIISV